MCDSAEYFGTCAKAPSRGTSRCLPEVLETAQDGDYPGRAQLKGDNQGSNREWDTHVPRVMYG